MPLRLRENRNTQRLQLQRREDGTHVSEGFMEGGGLMTGRSPQLRLDRVEDGMAHLMANDVRALTGIDRAAVARAMEEVEGFAVVVGVQILAFVEQDLQHGAH